MTDKAAQNTIGKMFDLEPRQENFVYEYMVDLNATQATKRAGYSEKGASVQGSRLLANVNIQDAIAHLRKKRADRYEITAENVLAEYAKIGFNNLDDYVDTTGDLPRIDFRGLSRDELAAVSEITVDTRYEYEMVDGERSCVGTIDKVKFKLHDKQKALEALSRNLGLFEKDNKQTAPTIVIEGRAADL